MPATITAGVTAFGSWSAWTAVQHGDEDDKGYNSRPPGAWVTPQRAIMAAGDLVGVRAACFAGCGDLSVEFSLDNGTVLSVTTPTVETDEWGKTLAYWFALPSGMSAGRHEIRARIKPSICGLERILQGSTETVPSWSNEFDTASSSLVIAINPVAYIARVEVGGSATGSGGINQGTGLDTATAYSSIPAAAEQLRIAMGLGNQNHGAVIYVGEGEWNANTTYTPDSLYWLTVKRNPAASKALTKLTCLNNSGSPAQASWVKYQGFTIRLDIGSEAILYAASGASNYWFDDCDIVGRGQEISSQGVVANGGYRFKWVTRLNQTGLRAQNIAGGYTAFCRHVSLVDCTSDILTGIPVSIGGVVRNHRALGWVGGVWADEHGDFFQRHESSPGIEGLVIADWDVECVVLSPTPGVDQDNGMAMFQGIPLSGVTVGHDDNTLTENVRVVGLGSGGGMLGLWGRIGSILRNVTCSKGLSIETGFPCDSHEITNCVFGFGQSGDFYSRIKANGKYEGNHNISGTNADTTDTTGEPDWDEDGIPDEGGNLAGRNRVTLRDASVYRRSDPTYAGAFAALSEHVIAPVASPSFAVVESGMYFSMTVPSGLTCRYTTNGSTPTISTGTAYTAPIALTADVTYTIRNFDGSEPSVTTTAAYDVITNGTPAPPTNFRFGP